MISLSEHHQSVFHIIVGKFQQALAAKAIAERGSPFGLAQVHAPAFVAGGGFAPKSFSAGFAGFHSSKYNPDLIQKHCEMLKHLFIRFKNSFCQLAYKFCEENKLQYSFDKSHNATKNF